MKSRQPIVAGPAAVALSEFLLENRISIRAASEALGISHPSVIAWLDGRAKPDAARRKQIAIWTQDQVPEGLWLSEDEITAISAQRVHSNPNEAA